MLLSNSNLLIAFYNDDKTNKIIFKINTDRWLIFPWKNRFLVHNYYSLYLHNSYLNLNLLTDKDELSAIYRKICLLIWVWHWYNCGMNLSKYCTGYNITKLLKCTFNPFTVGGSSMRKCNRKNSTISQTFYIFNKLWCIRWLLVIIYVYQLIDVQWWRDMVINYIKLLNNVGHLFRKTIEVILNNLKCFTKTI